MLTLRRVLPVLALVALAACSGSDDDAGGSDDQSAGTTETTTEPPATTDATATTTPATTEPTATTSPATTEPTAETTEPPATTTPPTTEPMAEEWAPIGDGEYEVGVATITVDDPEGVRPLTVDVWFPLDAGVDVSELAAQQYTLLPDVYYESPDAFAATAEQATTDGPFPLVVYSHGSGGLRYIHSSYTEALASHGYVVAAPDHTGNTAIERIADASAPFDETALNRPTDIGRVIDAMVDPAHPTAGPFAGHVDPEQVAVTGHSFGGFTSLAVVTGYSNELGEFAPDDRVDAIVPLAPAVGAESLPDELLATIDVPMMVLVGTDDQTTPVDPNVTRLWDVTTNSPAYRIEFVAAEHQTFTDLCDYQVALLDRENVPEVVITTIDELAVEGCSDGDMPIDRAVDLTNTYVLEFLDQVLHGGPAIESPPPDDVIFEVR